MAIFNLFYWETPIGWEWPLLLLMGVLTQFAQINMTKALQSTTLNKIAGFKYFGLVFAISFDLLIFGVDYTLFTLFGMLLVVSGVLLNLFSKR
jgi:drug/metabolite transporter (DMT)-like permease